MNLKEVGREMNNPAADFSAYSFSAKGLWTRNYQQKVYLHFFSLFFEIFR